MKRDRYLNLFYFYDYSCTGTHDLIFFLLSFSLCDHEFCHCGASHVRFVSSSLRHSRLKYKSSLHNSQRLQAVIINSVYILLNPSTHMLTCVIYSQCTTPRVIITLTISPHILGIFIHCSSGNQPCISLSFMYPKVNSRAYLYVVSWRFIMCS